MRVLIDIKVLNAYTDYISKLGLEIHYFIKTKKCIHVIIYRTYCIFMHMHIFIQN